MTEESRIENQESRISRRGAVAYSAVIAGLAFAALVLWLNLREPDIYDHSLAARPAGPVNQEPPPWVPKEAELTENLLWVRVEDRDGWYRLFWAGSETYWFDDAAYFAGAMVNRGSRLVEGRWTLKGAALAAEYELREGPPPEGMRDGLPNGVHWCAREYRRGLRAWSWVRVR